MNEQEEQLLRIEARISFNRAAVVALIIAAVIATVILFHREVRMESRMNRIEAELESVHALASENERVIAVLGQRMSALEEVIRTAPALQR